MHTIDAGMGKPELIKEIIPAQVVIPTPFDYIPDVKDTELINLHARLGTLPEYEDLVFGCGSTQLLTAYIRMVVAREGQARVYVQKPHYHRITEIVNAIDGAKFSEPGRTNLEYVIPLNNPDAKPHKKLTNAKYAIYDCAYLWPQYCGDVEPAQIFAELEFNDLDLVTFSFSKSIGLAGARLGYGFTFDSKVTDYLKSYQSYDTLNAPALLPLCLGICTEFDAIASQVYDELCYRFSKLRELLPREFKLLNSHGPYAWIKGNHCKFMEQFKVKVNPGSYYSAPGHFRINLLISCNDFDEIVNRLRDYRESRM